MNSENPENAKAKRKNLTLKKKYYSTLLISADKKMPKNLRKLFNEVEDHSYMLEQVDNLEEAAQLLKESNFDVALLDSAISGEQIIEDLEALYRAIDSTAIVVVIDGDDDGSLDLESELLHSGAQEVLYIGKLNAAGIRRAINHAYDRHQVYASLEYERRILLNMAEGLKKGDFDFMAPNITRGLHSKIDAGLLKENATLLRKIHQQSTQLQQWAHYDALTELPNRLSFDRFLNQELAYAKRHQHLFAVLFLDLDGFKKVNDRFGHHIGDYLLKAVAKRLSTRLRASDFIARIGGDEFAIVLRELKNSHGAGIAAQKLLNTLQLPFSIENLSLKVGVSIGIAFYPSAGDSGEILVQKADVAMYNSKKLGGNAYQFSDDDSHKMHIHRLKLEEALRHSIEKNEIFLNYQPIFNLATHRLDGMEALLRWRHPEYGLVSPATFIPIAEDTGFIIPLGEWVVTNACKQFVEWRRKGYKNVQLAINLSPKQIMNDGIINMIADVLDTTSIPEKYLELEVTEMAIMTSGDESTSAILQRLHKIGAKNVIDDFGTGYSSLSRLTSLEVTTLKIDRSFVAGIGKGSDDEVIINSIINLAENLGLETVAEGIETQEQIDYLTQHDCHRGQGFLFSKPLDADAMTAFLTKHS